MVKLPIKNKACIYDEPGKISTKVVELNVPELGRGEVLVNITHSGVCRSDLDIMTNNWAAPFQPTHPGQVGGHEGVGVVVKLSPDVDASLVKVGDRVGIKWIGDICGACPHCQVALDSLCLNPRVSGCSAPGTFQQYVAAPAKYLTRIPDKVSSAAAVPMLCAGLTAYSALKRSGARRGDWILLLGAGGGIGHIACQIASRVMGMRVIGIDSQRKKDLVLECGAELFVDHQHGCVAGEVKAATAGLGAQAVLVLTGAVRAYAGGMSLLRSGGTLVCVGIPIGAMKPIETAYVQEMITRELAIKGILVGALEDADETLNLAKEGAVRPRHRTARMEELTGVFQKMKDERLDGKVVLELGG